MRVRMVKMFNKGVEIERRMLNDSSTLAYRGELLIMDVTDQGRHRPTKLARLKAQMGPVHELLDVHVVWVKDDRMTLTGDERVPSDNRGVICYKQSWLCMIE